MDGDAFGLHECGGMIRQRRSDAPLLQMIDARHRRRAEVEAFIAQRYREAYGARVAQFMPSLFALLGPDDEILSAAGMRRGSEGALFVEHYLDAPAEFVLAEHFGCAVDRRRLVEIGHLSGLGSGTGRRLFPLLAHCLQESGVEWAVFAATRALRSQFERMGVCPQALAPARRERLGLAADAWGSYYDTDPWVVGGPLQLGQHLIVAPQ